MVFRQPTTVKSFYQCRTKGDYGQPPGFITTRVPYHGCFFSVLVAFHHHADYVHCLSWPLWHPRNCTYVPIGTLSVECIHQYSHIRRQEPWISSCTSEYVPTKILIHWGGEKWPPTPIHFLVSKLLYFDWHFTKNYSQGANWSCVGSDNSLAPLSEPMLA